MNTVLGSGRRRAVAALVVAASMLIPSLAHGGFVDAHTATPTFGTATLSPPSSLTTAAGTCTPAVTDRIRLTWTATPSTWATGYRILRSLVSGGPYTQIATTTGTTYTDSSVAFSTTYHYVVQARYLSWTSVSSNQATRTTKSATCL